MRIAYLSPCAQMGGAESSLGELIETIRAAQPDWEVYLVAGEDGPLVEAVKRLGVQVTVARFPRALARLGDAGLGNAGSRPMMLAWSLCKSAVSAVIYSRRLAEILRAIEPDIIHSNGFKMHLLGVWARSRKTPVIWHIRDYVSARVVMRRLLGLHAGFCSYAIGNSQSVAKDIETVCGSKVETGCVYNAVDLVRFAPDGDKADLDVLAGLAPAAPGTIRVGLLATLARWKGHQVFLRAVAQLPPTVAFRAYVIGGPIYQTQGSQYTLEELKHLATQLGVQGKVGFTGFTSEPASAIRSLDIVVHASTEPEPFGRAIAEAMACGRPVIVSSCGGAQELITNGQDALAHSPGDYDGLAAQIERLALDEELRLRMGRSGRATAERRFATTRLAAQLVPIYRQVTGAAPSDETLRSGALS